MPGFSGRPKSDEKIHSQQARTELFAAATVLADSDSDSLRYRGIRARGVLADSTPIAAASAANAGGFLQTSLSEVTRRSGFRRSPALARRVTPDRVLAFLGSCGAHRQRPRSRGRSLHAAPMVQKPGFFSAAVFLPAQGDPGCRRVAHQNRDSRARFAALALAHRIPVSRPVLALADLDFRALPPPHHPRLGGGLLSA